MSKQEQLLKLTRKRQRTRWSGYKGIGDYHGGVYECDFVSPYTKSAGNLEAKVMIMLQDWSSDASLSKMVDQDSIEFGHTRFRPTNKNLKKLLEKHFGLSLAETYATNLFPYIKTGSMNNYIPVRDLTRAAKEFALPQIEIISPELVICLGKATFNALRRTIGLKPVKYLDDGIKSPFPYHNSVIYCQAHTSPQGQNYRNRGKVDRVSKDWKRMAKEYLNAA